MRRIHFAGGAYRQFCACALAFLTAVCASLAAEKPQPWSYDTVVQPMSHAAWLDRVIILDSNYHDPFVNPGTPELAPWAKKLQEAGFTPMTYTPLERIDIAHQAGVKVVRGMRPFVREGWVEETINRHPEWLRMRKPGVPFSEDAACLISPFGDELIRILAENVRNHGIDAYTFDGWYQMQYCCCDWCRKTYRSETGLEVPPSMDPRKLEYRKYLLWRDGKLLERAIQLRRAVKRANPDAALINWSNNDANGAYPSCMPEALNCVFDMTWKEWWNANDPYSIWLNKRLRGSAGDRPPAMQPYLFMRWMKDIQAGVYHGSSAPMPEVRYQIHEAMTFGAIPIIWSGARAGWKSEDWDTYIQDVIDFLPAVHETKTLKYAACIDSYTTLQMSGIPAEGDFHGPMEKMLNERVAFHRGGFARVMLESHIPFDVIAEHNVTAETLAQYRVIILPNNACMSERMAGVLRDYVAGGGGLVATFETSLYDGLGEKRKDFALSDVFGAQYASTVETSACRIDFADTEHPVTADEYLRDLMGTRGYNTYWGRFTRVNAADGAVSPMMGLDVANEKDASKKTWAPLLCSTFQKGRSAYFPAAMDSAYYDASYPYQRRLLANAIRWAAGEGPAVTVTAPMCVLAGFFTKDVDGKRQTIVHLLNDANTTMGHSSAGDKEFAFREEVLPITGVQVTFRGEKPGSVKVIPGGTELKPVQVQGGWTVTVPALGLHAALIAE